MYKQQISQFELAFFRFTSVAVHLLILTMFVLCLAFSAVVPAKAATRYEAGISTNLSLLRMSDKTLNKRLSDIKALGAEWVRIDFNWALIQPKAANRYDWKLYDRLVRITGQHGLKILAVLSYTPSWARKPACNKAIVDRNLAMRCTPRSAYEFSRFAAVASHRYKGQAVRAWEIWNEPNLTGYWKTVGDGGTPFVDAKMYARIADGAAQQIRYHYPDSVIVVGGLAPMFEPHTTTGMRQSEFLRTVLPHLHSQYFDAVGVHPYTWPILPDTVADYNAFYTVDGGKEELSIRAVMDEKGWSDKEIWATEFGAGTQGLRVSTTREDIERFGRPDHVTEDMQARIIRKGMELWYHKDNVGPMFVHSDSDRWLTPHKANEAGFGLRRHDGTPKPAYQAFQAAAAQLR